MDQQQPEKTHAENNVDLHLENINSFTEYPSFADSKLADFNVTSGWMALYQHLLFNPGVQ